MDDMQQKLNAILGNPELMQQLMGMAQSLGQSQSPPAPPPAPQQSGTSSISPEGFRSQGLDIAAIQRIAGLAQQTGIDKNQQALLRALSPYLNCEHIAKLEKAMRAAKLAGIAGTLLGNSTLFSLGR